MPNHLWTDYELQFVRQNAGVLKDVEIARKLSAVCGRLVTLHSVRKARQKLGIFKRRGRGMCELSRPAVPAETP